MAKQLQIDEVRTARNQDDLLVQQAKEDLRKFITLALTRFKSSEEASAEVRREMLEDWRFSIGEQWPSDIKSQRTADGRPCLVMDHLNQSIKQVANEQRQQRPAIQINPVGDGATRQVADVLQGIIRHIEVNCDAEIAYDTSFEQMLRGGLSWIRVLTQFAPGLSFDQDIRIESFQNIFRIYADPASIRIDNEDLDFLFIIEDVPRWKYAIEYPRSQAASLTDFQSVGDIASAWATKETIRIAEYYHVEYEPKKIVQLKSGAVVEKTPELAPDDIIDEREYLERKIVWSKINAIERLEEDVVLDCSVIPVFRVVGDDIEFNGKKYQAGMVRRAKDPQRMYNYQCSAATELSALAPKAPWVGAVGQFKSKEAQWKTANRTNWAFLEYDTVSIAGQPAPAPQRQVVEAPIQAAVLLMRAAGEDLKASIGIYDASLGAPGPEQSGRAILARQKQGDIATLNFSDNLARTMRAVGRCVLELIPKVYTVPKIQRIINPDQSVKHVAVFNSDLYSPDDAKKLIGEELNVVPEIFDIGKGNYDVAVSVGPSYQSRRKEASEAIQSLVQAYPNIMEVAGDLLVGNMDWPYAQEIAKRLKKTIPPNLVDDSDQSPEAKMAAMEQQLQQLTQQHQQLTQAYQQADEIIKTKTVEANAKLQGEQLRSKTQIALAMIDREVKMATAEISTKAQIVSERERAVHEVWQDLHQAAHEQATTATAPQPEPIEQDQSQGGNQGGA